MARVSIKTDLDGHLGDIGRAIRDARKSRKVSQEALADASGIDRSHMGKIERGERNVSVLNLISIAKALETRLSVLLEAAGL